MKNFEVDADEFLRHCAAKKVTISTIAEAFAGCKPKAKKEDSAAATAAAKNL